MTSPVPLARRLETPADASFLSGLFRAHRAAAFAVPGLPAASLDALLRMQVQAQAEHYRRQWPQARAEIVLDAGAAAIGRLLTARSARELRLIDIALLPACCGRGLGTRLIAALIDEAGAAGLPLTAHVARDNPARRLYARLGFREHDDGGPYLAIVYATSGRDAYVQASSA